MLIFTTPERNIWLFIAVKCFTLSVCFLLLDKLVYRGFICAFSLKLPSTAVGNEIYELSETGSKLVKLWAMKTKRQAERS